MAAKKVTEKRFLEKIPLKLILGIGAVCVLVILGFAANGILKDRQAKEESLPVVATLDGYPITAREVEVRLTEGRGYIRNYFEQKYNVLKENATFWDTDFEGTTPMDYGRDYYYGESLRIKMTQILARKYGLTQDISYSSFVTRWEAENARRQETVDKGGNVPGMVQYSETDYFDIEFSSLEEKLFDTLVKKNKLPVTEAEKKTYYEENRDRRYKKQDKYTFQVVTAAISPTTENGDDPKARAAIQAFADRLRAGERFEDLTAKVEQGEFPGLEYKVIQVDEDTDLLEMERVASLLDRAGELKLNEVSPVLTSLFYYYSIGRYTAYEEMGYYEFEEQSVQNNIEYVLQVEKFTKYIKEMVDKADVKRNDELYRQIALPQRYR